MLSKYRPCCRFPAPRACSPARSSPACRRAWRRWPCCCWCAAPRTPTPWPGWRWARRPSPPPAVRRSWAAGSTTTAAAACWCRWPPGRPSSMCCWSWPRRLTPPAAVLVVLAAMVGALLPPIAPVVRGPPARDVRRSGHARDRLRARGGRPGGAMDHRPAGRGAARRDQLASPSRWRCSAWSACRGTAPVPALAAAAPGAEARSAAGAAERRSGAGQSRAARPARPGGADRRRARRDRGRAALAGPARRLAAGLRSAAGAVEPRQHGRRPLVRRPGLAHVAEPPLPHPAAARGAVRSAADRCPLDRRRRACAACWPASRSRRCSPASTRWSAGR